MTLERLQRLHRVNDPRLDRAVVRCRFQHLAVWRENHGVDRPRMAVERLQHGARPGVPQLDRAVVRCRRQRLAVRREGQAWT